MSEARLVSTTDLELPEVRHSTIRCDDCHIVYTSRLVQATHWAVREEAKKHGWVHLSGEFDFCEECGADRP